MNDSNKIDQMLKRLERLEAMEEIRHLKQRSAVAADPQMDIDMFVDLYTEDGVMEFTNWETVLNGRDEIRAFLEVNPFTWMFHCLIPIRIEVAEIASQPRRAGTCSKPPQCITPGQKNMTRCGSPASTTTR